MVVDQLDRLCSRKRQLPGHELEKDHSQGVEIRALVNSTVDSPGLLRRDVCQVSHHVLGSISLLRTSIDSARGTKVNEVDRPCRALLQEDVSAVEIQMDDTLLMDVPQDSCEIDRNLES